LQQVNILLATYNGEKYLEQQLDSIFSQTFKNWLLIIHDDNSTDQTVGIIRKYVKQHPDKINFIDDTISFGSASGNFSFLLQQADSDYIMFCDQDDIWLPQKIELTLTKMREMEHDFPARPLLVHTDLTVVDENMNVLGESFWKYANIDPTQDSVNALILQNVVTGCTLMINKSLLSLSKPIPKEVIMHDWWIALVASLFGEIGIVETPTLLYRQHGGNDTGAKKYDLKYIFWRIVKRPTIDKYFTQANLIGARYGTMISAEQKKLFDDIRKWKEAGFFRKRSIIIRHRLWKQSFVRKLGLLILV